MAKQYKQANHEAPLIPASTRLPEFTFKVIITAIILTVLLGASNAYLALKVGTTVAASIPAAVISMGIFRFFKKSNPLESNLVQTSASAGEGLACSLTFILPALLILGYWTKFNFWETTAIAMLGGIVGVLFSVPLRKVLLNLGLPFPEGTAIGNVLKASAAGSNQMKYLTQGGAVGGIIAFAQTGLQIISDHIPLWVKSGKTLFGLSIGFDPVLMGAGYIIGFNACSALFLGMIVAWLFGVPILSQFYPASTGGSAEDMVMTLWSQHIRYIGVGCMVVGGVWTLLNLIRPIYAGMSSAFVSMKAMRLKGAPKILRTEQDIPMQYILWGLAIAFIATFFLVFYFIKTGGLGLPMGLTLGIALICTLYVLVFGFICSVICGYLVGLIGSTNTPLSGILIINVLALSLILFPLASIHADLSVHGVQQAAIAIVIFIAALIAAAAVITNENIQDLKAGYMVGATPWKQQLMMIMGVVITAFIVAPVMELLFNAYGIGGVFPHPGMNPSQMLSAPQAGLMAALAAGVIGHNVPWNMLIAGGIIAIGGIFIDEFLKTKGTRLAVLAIGLGIYLPPEIITPVVIGGTIHYFGSRALRNRTKNLSEEKRQKVMAEMQHPGPLLACGLIAGSSLMGVALAIPFVLKGSSDALRIVSDSFHPIANIIGVITILGLCVWMYQTSCRWKK